MINCIVKSQKINKGKSKKLLNKILHYIEHSISLKHIESVFIYKFTYVLNHIVKTRSVLIL